jgi:hypothetical protein
MGLVHKDIGLEPMEKLIAFNTGCCIDLQSTDCHTSRENGNGRTVRNLMEALARAMARRVMALPPPRSPKALSTLTMDELTSVTEEMAIGRFEQPCGGDGILAELTAAANADDGLYDWLQQFKLSEPTKRLRALVREVTRLNNAVPSYSGSSVLKSLSTACTSNVAQMRSAVASKIEATCGNEGVIGGELKTILGSIDPPQDLTAEEFESVMKRMSTTVKEAFLLMKLFAGSDVPEELAPLQAATKACSAGISTLKSKSIIMPLEAAALLD